VLWSFAFIPALSWSPDGEWLALAEKPDQTTAARIVRLELPTLDKQPLTTPPEGSAGDLFPALSPDGRLLAFVRSASSTQFGNQDIWVQPVAGGPARQLTFERYSGCGSPSWTPDGNEIVFSANQAIYRVSTRGGSPRPVAGAGRNTDSPSIRGNRMVYTQRTPRQAALWRTTGPRAPTTDRSSRKLISSTSDNDHGEFSPEGRRIAFESDRSGIYTIWVCDSEGTNPAQLTSLYAGTPRWSPDGRELVFDSAADGNWNLYVIDADGGVPRRLTNEPSAENVPYWSRDGRWIYFGSNRGGRLQIWKIPAEGGSWVQLTHGGGAAPQESPDGRYVYYSRGTQETSGIWRIPVAGGREEQVLEESVFWTRWDLSGSGIYFATQPNVNAQRGARRTTWIVRRLDLQTGRVTEVLRREGAFRLQALTVSPNEEWILHSEASLVTSELMLVENFR
jgi:Tol biopolymer transport system component